MHKPILESLLEEDPYWDAEEWLPALHYAAAAFDVEMLHIKHGTI